MRYTIEKLFFEIVSTIRYFSKKQAPLLMPKTASIIFLLLFSAMQYGKLISYWNCRIINSTSLLSTHCDCEKILTADHSSTGDYHTSPSIQIKTEEWTEYVSISKWSFPCRYLSDKMLAAGNDSLSNGFYYPLIHPPRG